jgi:hypothetical protein
MSPPRIPDKRTILEPFQFSIAVENAMHNNWFADKIVDCFIAKTVPIYWGCPNLDQYFNMAGVIRFSSYEDMEQKIAALTPEVYGTMLTAVEDNFTRALQYVHTLNRIDEKITEGIANKQRLNLQHTEAVPQPRQVRLPARPIPCPNQ